jgi:hypothetical protein
VPLVAVTPTAAAGAEKEATMEVEMDRNLREGQGVVLDANGKLLGVVAVPGGKPIPGGARLLLSIEDYGRYIRAAADWLRR